MANGTGITDKTNQDNWSGVIFDSDTPGMVYGNPTLETDAKIPDGKGLTIPEGSSLTVSDGVKLELNNSTLTIDSGATLTNNGTISGNGGKVDGNGSFGGSGTVESGVTVPQPKDSTVSISPSSATYGSEVTLTATISESATTLTRAAARGKVAFYLKVENNNVELGTADVIDNTASLTITLSGETWEKGFQLGENTIMAEFGGDLGLSSSSATGTLTVNPMSQTALATPELEKRDRTSITLKAVGENQNGATAEYSKDEGASWQASPVFTDLSSGTTYRFVVRYTAIGVYGVSSNSPVAEFSTEGSSGGSGGSSGGDSSSSGSSGGDHTVSVDADKHGTVTVSPKRADKGDTVTITVKPDKGYELDELTVTDKSGDTVKLKDQGNGKFTFTMPGSKVTVEASFKQIDAEPEVPAFADVPTDAYYADAVAWAVKEGITSGTSAAMFTPNASCTRAQIVTFLWRANGSPVVNYAMSFTDVPADAYYAEAVRWAVSEGITTGTTATTFSPDATVTRAQAVTFIYRNVQAQGGGFTGSWMFPCPFTDVPADAYYFESVQWCAMKNITSGTSADTFSPNAPCTRAQIVTFLYRETQ